MLHNVHHEQRIAVRALVDEGSEWDDARPSKPLNHIRRHVGGGQARQAHFHALTTPI
jgi:hypothetical protein